MIEYGAHVVLRLEGQRTRSRENLYHADDAEEEEHHPDGLVSLEKITYFYVHGLQWN